jgi:hypothetical protein
MTRPELLNDGEINAIVERARHDPATCGDLSRYLHHAEQMSRFARREPGPGKSEEYLDGFRTKYRLPS